jgi:hypothetical protein
MSKVKHKSISEEELRKFYDSLPEASSLSLERESVASICQVNIVVPRASLTPSFKQSF